MAWKIEFHTVALNKLKEKFFDALQYNRFTVKAIKKENFVTTFRVKKMSDFLIENVEKFKNILENDYANAGEEGLDDLQSMDSSQQQEDNTHDESMMKQGQGTGAGGVGQKKQSKKFKTEAERVREERKFSREERKRELAKLEKEEAKYNVEDPEDRKRIEHALATFGDFKLKMSPEYIVPERERVNAEKKRQQMVLLENSIFNMKVEFNRKLEDLKARKQDIIEIVKTRNDRITTINGNLGIEDGLFYPSVDEELEYPEKFFETDDDQLEQFAIDQAQLELDAAAGAKGSSMFGSKKQTSPKNQEPIKVNLGFEKING